MIYLYKQKMFFFFVLLFWHSLFFSGFSETTLVRTYTDCVPIETLEVGDILVGVGEENEACLVCVANKHSYVSESVYEIQTEYDHFIVDGRQRFYDPFVKKWIYARELSEDNMFLSIDGTFVPCLSVKKRSQATRLYDLSVDTPNTFLVGTDEIVVHNVAFVLGATFAFGGGLSFEGISLAICGIGLAAYNFFKGKDKLKVEPYVESFTPPSPTPDPEDPEKEKEKIKIKKKKGTKKKIRNFKFLKTVQTICLEKRKGIFLVILQKIEKSF